MAQYKMGKKLSVLMVSEYFSPIIKGGGEISAYLLAKNLAREGVDVSVLTSHFPGLKYYEKKEGINIYRRLKTGKDPNSLIQNIKRALLFFGSTKKEVIRLCEEKKFDIVHCLNTTSMVGVSKAKKKIGLPIVSTINSYTPLCPKANLFREEEKVCLEKCHLGIYLPCILKSSEIGKIKNKFYLRYNPLFLIVLYFNFLKRRNSLKKFDYLTCISEYSKRMLIKNGFKENKIRVIYNIVEPNIKPKKRRSNKISILYLGAYTKFKGPQVLLEALKNLDDYECDFYGKGPLKEELIQSVENNFLKARVNDEIPQKDVYQKIADSNIVVFPSLWPEPMGRVIIESMAAGKIIIGSNVGGIPDLIKQGKTGFLFEAGNPKELSEKIMLVKRNAKMVKKIKENANLYSKNYTGKNISNQFKEYYSLMKEDKQK